MNKLTISINDKDYSVPLHGTSQESANNAANEAFSKYCYENKIGRHA